MASPLNGAILDTVRTAVCTALDWLVPSEQCSWTLTGIDVSVHDSATHPSSGHILSIDIETNNRPLLLGLFLNFPRDGLRGFHDNYIIAFAQASVLARHGIRLGDLAEIVLDVRQAGEMPGDLYQLLTLDEACRLGYVTPQSILAEQVRRFGLPGVMVAGYALSGPSPGMIGVVESLCRAHAPSLVIDVFAGTGSLGRVALLSGAAHVTSFEHRVTEKVARGPDLLERWSWEEADVFADTMDWPQCDLLISDPFYDHALAVAQRLFPRWRYSCRGVVMNLGPCVATDWSARCTETIRRAGFEVKTEARYGELIAICS